MYVVILENGKYYINTTIDNIILLISRMNELQFTIDNRPIDYYTTESRMLEYYTIRFGEENVFVE
jgi:hypothetical protein